MGKNELRELRKQAERAIADAERTSTIAGMTAMAKTLMYVGELLAVRLESIDYQLSESGFTAAQGVSLADMEISIAGFPVTGWAGDDDLSSTPVAEFTAEPAPDNTHTHISDCTGNLICVCGHCQCQHHNHGPEVRGHCHESRQCGCETYNGPRYMSDQWWRIASDA